MNDTDTVYVHTIMLKFHYHSFAAVNIGVDILSLIAVFVRMYLYTIHFVLPFLAHVVVFCFILYALYILCNW